MVYQLWFAVIGSNGDGLASQMRDTRERVGHIEDELPKLWSREDHEKAEAAYQAKDAKKAEDAAACKDRRKMSRREVIMLALTGIGSLGAIGSVFVAIAALTKAAATGAP
jgi:hypothetical protein